MKGVLIDMDGVIYRGSAMIPGADHFIALLKEANVPFLFLTNNSRSTRRDLAARLVQLGIEVEDRHIYTSAMATAEFMAQQKPNGSAFVLGEGGLILALHEAGYAIVEKAPDYVVVGEGRSLTLEAVEKAIDFVIAGSRLIATNLDPAPRVVGWPKPGTAAVVAMLESATGKKAFSVGKPSPVMMRSARKSMGLSASQTVMIGDTMDTDILGGIQMGYQTILVLTGWSSRESLQDYAFSPSMIVESVADLSIEELLR